ncbi:MAG: hypothetical protein ABI648_11580 [Betaproteobacteria bacterium]
MSQSLPGITTRYHTKTFNPVIHATSTSMRQRRLAMAKAGV